MLKKDKINIALINCVSQKQSGLHPAAELYTSPLFKKSWAYVTKILRPQGAYILSAKHGLVRYDDKISKYDLTLNNMKKDEKEEWAKKVIAQIEERFCVNGKTLDDYNFIIMAGVKYYEGLIDHLPHHDLILGKLRVGERLQILGNAVNNLQYIQDGKLVK